MLININQAGGKPLATIFLTMKDSKQFEQVMAILGEAMDAKNPVLILAAGKQHLAVFAQGNDQTMTRALIAAMEQDKKFVRLFRMALEIYDKMQPANTLAEGLGKFIDKLLKENDFPHDPLDCATCDKSGDCEIETEMNDMLIKKVKKHGTDYKA